MKKIRNIPPSDRPREKIARKGAESLSDKELVAAIIGSGMKGKDVFEVAGDVVGMLGPGLSELRFSKLAGVKGMGTAKASQVLASFELARRYLPPPEKRIKISEPGDVLPLVKFLEGKRQEHFVVVTLNGANEVIETRIVTVGLLNHSLVHPREVFADAITDRAAAIICVHNHPSGTLEPSSQDIAITRQLVEAGDLLGIRVLDHLIVTGTGFVSLKERGQV
jgi:DNA repair protein RadC